MALFDAPQKRRVSNLEFFENDLVQREQGVKDTGAQIKDIAEEIRRNSSGLSSADANSLVETQRKLDELTPADIIQRRGEMQGTLAATRNARRGLKVLGTTSDVAPRLQPAPDLPTYQRPVKGEAKIAPLAGALSALAGLFFPEQAGNLFAGQAQAALQGAENRYAEDKEQYAMANEDAMRQYNADLTRKEWANRQIIADVNELNERNKAILAHKRELLNLDSKIVGMGVTTKGMVAEESNARERARLQSEKARINAKIKAQQDAIEAKKISAELLKSAMQGDIAGMEQAHKNLTRIMGQEDKEMGRAIDWAKLEEQRRHNAAVVAARYAEEQGKNLRHGNDLKVREQLARDKMASELKKSEKSQWQNDPEYHNLKQEFDARMKLYEEEDKVAKQRARQVEQAFAKDAAKGRALAQQYYGGDMWGTRVRRIEYRNLLASDPVRNNAIKLYQEAAKAIKDWRSDVIDVSKMVKPGL